MVIKGFLNLTLFLLLINFARTNGTAANMTRIVGGKVSFIGNNQYMVRVLRDNSFICGGALLNRNFVLCAAHCVVSVGPGRLTIVGGVNTASQRGVRRRVQKIIRPRSFSMTNMNNDVAVFKLRRPMVGPKISYIPLYNGRLRRGMRLKVSGWGLRSELANAPARHLRSVIVPVLAHSRCVQQYQSFIPITRTMFCAAKAGVKDSCSGDSGGPAVYRRQLVGIVSYGYGCARRNFAGVYTKVGAVRSFIRNALRQ